jgi:hypothetical protein
MGSIFLLDDSLPNDDGYFFALQQRHRFLKSHLVQLG